MSTSPMTGADAEAVEPDAQLSLFAGGGEIGALMRALDWGQTPLGPLANWPQSLKTSVSICLASRFPIVLYWGPEYVVLYNNAYSQILGSKHPWAMGQTCRVCWAEIWDTIGPMLDGVLATGEATWSDDLLLMLRRFGYPEECYFSFSFSPVRAESGTPGGVFTAVIETTEKVIGERRLRTLRDLAARAVTAKCQQSCWQIAAAALAENATDVPFAILCEVAGDELKVAGTAGIDSAHPLCASLCRPGSALHAKAMQVLATCQAVEWSDLATLAEDLPRGTWDTVPSSAMLLPIAALGQGSSGLMLAAASPAKRLDESYRAFFDLLARQIATNIADARAHEEERKRSEALAELDRAKTAFFSNVSHEFRTPLTLMLGPLDEVLGYPQGEISEPHRQQLGVVRRNALRLLKLVNTLLDFSCIEAGRMQATYEATELCAFTAEVASVFRSAMEKAGLNFPVVCEPLSEPAYVDREMWERIVLNLVSNAFKFTFEGEVAVTLRQAGERAELAVRDTGTGIAREDLPRLFERFHRIENAQSRTYEGTGIGLALVQELARLHGGTLSVESEAGRGSTFTVSIPMGRAHLPAERVGSGRMQTPPRGDAYVEEAERWLPDEFAAQAHAQASPLLSWSASDSEPPPRVRIVIADDNADMRQYLARLLGDTYEVHAVANGVDAVEAAVRLRPALVLADVMMPGLDGFGVLRAIRTDAALSGTPVILLSARAGEESRVEGLEAGADDYLVKPFTARELMARVGTHIRMAGLRREAAEMEARLRAEAELERARLRELLQQAPAAIGLLNGPEHRWTYVNDLYVRVTGRGSAKDFIGKSVRESLPELEGQPFFELLDEVYRTGRPCVGREAEARLNRGPGGQLESAYFDFVYQPMRAAGGDVEGVLLFAVEVSEKVAARRLLEESHRRLTVAHLASQRLAAIVESSDDAIVSKDLNGIVTSWNPGAQNIFGYTAEEMVGRPITTIIPPELLDDERRILATIARGERIEHFETVRIDRSGERIDVSLTISPVRDEAGTIVGVSKIARDIRQRKKTEQTLRTTERLATVGRLAATIAHEINNPLEALTNLVYLARTNTCDEQIRPYLAQAEEELARVSVLTRQTLGFYRETRGVRRLRVGELTAPLVAAMQPRARNRGVGIRTEFRRDPQINCIPGEVRQLIANLLNNSIDVAPAGSTIRVRISAARFIGGQRKTGVRLTVADSGPGIPPNLRARLFEAFFTTKKEVGTGLGLWVSKNIVERHGGQIRLRSSTRPGKTGTVFSVLLPARAQVKLADIDPADEN